MERESTHKSGKMIHRYLDIPIDDINDSCMTTQFFMYQLVKTDVKVDKEANQQFSRCSH